MARPLRSLARLALAAAALVPPLAAQDGPEEPHGIDLSDIGLERLQIGGQVRVRAEHRNRRPPTIGAPNQTLTLLRARINARAWFTEYISAFAEGQARIASQGAGTNEQLHQAYVELADMFGSLTLQAGRFEMAYGNQRMVSPLDWSQSARAWDGGRLQFESGEFAVDAFATLPVRQQGGITGDEEFYGFYAQWNGEPLQIDGYVFKRKDDTLRLDDYTVGGLLETEVDIVKFDFEAAYQTGDRGTLDVGAYALAARVVVDLDAVHLGAGFELASGDSNPIDGDLGTFVPLFNFAHAWQGYADIVVWQNLQDIVLLAHVPIGERWKAMADLHFLSVADTADALYAGPGAGALVASGSRRIGTEFDLSVRGTIEGGLGIWTGISYFSAGPAILGGDDQIWLFLQVVLSF